MIRPAGTRTVPALLIMLALAMPLRATPPEPVGMSELFRNARAAGLRPAVLEDALRARARALGGGLRGRPILTVIDYSLPSRERRLWVLDLAGGRVLARELVAHGRATGDDLAHSFSNRPGSLQSSLGTFLTGSVYRGRHGLSLRLRGLDPGVNDRAEARAIVMHGAAYVSAETAARLGRLGRSQGCPALSPAAAPRVIQLIRDGTIVFAYFHA
jgi:L,D-transpeptidase catalytic domain